MVPWRQQFKYCASPIKNIAAQSSEAGQKMIARFSEAGNHFTKNNFIEGTSVLRRMIDDKSIGRLYRDYALLLEIRARSDRDDAQKLIDDLKPLTSGNNVWALHAHEMAAVLYAKIGQKDKALEELIMILQSPNASVAALERAKMLTRIYRE
jgi:hypothetical protein